MYLLPGKSGSSLYIYRYKININEQKTKANHFILASQMVDAASDMTIVTVSTLALYLVNLPFTYAPISLGSRY